MVQKIPASGLENAGGNFKNIFINGDMRIAQRATSATTITNFSYQTIDRLGGMETTDGTATLEQHAMSDADEATTGQKFAALFKCTGTDSSIGAAQYAGVYQHIEAQNLQHLNYGTSAAKDLTLSFWVKSNTTGTYSIGMSKADSTAYYIALTYTIDSADTWEKKVIHISPTAGSTSLITGANGVINNDNGTGFNMFIYTALGSNYHTASPNTWSSSAIYGTSDQPNLMSSTSNNWYITGLQLEVGDTASDFEFLPHDVQLQRCYRYCQRHPSQDPTSGSGYNVIGNGYNNSTTEQLSICNHYVPMRGDASLTNSGSFRIHHVNAAIACSSATTIDDNTSGAHNSLLIGLVSSGLTAGQGSSLEQNNDTDAHIILSAEL
tara:strand:+ start:56 stop:1192 length:1137 start_codon:yes stop_codon:yes gene_type:complete